MKISMIGCGKLGLPCAEVMASQHNVVGYDIAKFDSASVKSVDLHTAAQHGDIIFIAVPTPHDELYGGERPCIDLPVKDFDYTIVKNILQEINQYVNKQQLVVLISTVLPGTVRCQLEPLITNARFIYNPYLIAMGSVAWDFVNPEMVIIGTEDGDVSGDAKALIDFYTPLMQNSPRYEVGTWDEAEAIKIFYNTFISAKIGLVNMVQDVAERLGNINVDVVTTALANSTHRITGPAYMRAGMGDGGACHPRDNIALRWLGAELDLGYDLFYSIMQAREKQAENIAVKLVQLAKRTNLNIYIHGKAYKPGVSYTHGSYSLLIGHYIEQLGHTVKYIDPLTENKTYGIVKGVIMMAHHAPTTYGNTATKLNKPQEFYCNIEPGSVVVDPWRYLKQTDVPGCKLIHYGNTRRIR